MELVDLSGAETVVDLADRDGGLTWFVASTEAVNRRGFILKTKGIDTSAYERNPLFVWQHDAYGGFETPRMDSVLGSVEAIRKRAGVMKIGVRWADQENPSAAMAKSLVEGGFLNAVSVGVYLHEDSMKMEHVPALKREVPVYHKSELVENSLVMVPANQEATRQALALVREMERHVVSPDPAPASKKVADFAVLSEGVNAALVAQRVKARLRR